MWNCALMDRSYKYRPCITGHSLATIYSIQNTQYRLVQPEGLRCHQHSNSATLCQHTSANDATLAPPLHGHHVVENQSTTEHDPRHTSHEFSTASGGGGGGGGGEGYNAVGNMAIENIVVWRQCHLHSQLAYLAWNCIAEVKFVIQVHIQGYNFVE